MEKWTSQGFGSDRYSSSGAEFAVVYAAGLKPRMNRFSSSQNP